MRIAGIKYNDIVDGEGVCVSLWTQGCVFHCKGCHNPETWDFNGGKEIDKEILINNIITAISINNVQRNFSILGGEPLCPQNAENVIDIITAVREKYPDIKIFIWTGYKYENLPSAIKEGISKVDYIIDGQYEEDKRDIALYLRGSTNQRILKRNIDF